MVNRLLDGSVVFTVFAVAGVLAFCFGLLYAKTKWQPFFGGVGGVFVGITEWGYGRARELAGLFGENVSAASPVAPLSTAVAGCVVVICVFLLGGEKDTRTGTVMAAFGGLMLAASGVLNRLVA